MTDDELLILFNAFLRAVTEFRQRLAQFEAQLNDAWDECFSRPS